VTRQPRPAGQVSHDPLTTKEGWCQFVDDTPTPPALLPHSVWEELDRPARARYDHARLDHHARLLVVRTPTVDQVARTGRRLVLLNRHQISARRGLIVTGAAATGKTTAITQLGRAHELQARHRQPETESGGGSRRRFRPARGCAAWMRINSAAGGPGIAG
jgi:hypothetical protein